MNDIAAINKWLLTTKRTEPQTPRRTLYLPVRWVEQHYGYLLNHYDTSLESLVDEIAWTTGRRCDAQTLYDTLTKREHRFINVDTTMVCTTIEYERRRL